VRQRRPETAEGEHGEADQSLGGLKAEGTPRDLAELRVQALNAGVGQAIGERGLDQWGLFSSAIPDRLAFWLSVRSSGFLQRGRSGEPLMILAGPRWSARQAWFQISRQTWSRALVAH
jgi:hypothetical protein